MSFITNAEEIQTSKTQVITKSFQCEINAGIHAV